MVHSEWNSPYTNICLVHYTCQEACFKICPWKKKKIIAPSVWQAESYSDITWPLLYHHWNIPHQPSTIRAHSESRRGFLLEPGVPTLPGSILILPPHQIIVIRLSCSGFQGMEVSPAHPPPVAFSTSWCQFPLGSSWAPLQYPHCC